MNDNELVSIIEGMLFISGDDGIDIKTIKNILRISVLKAKELISYLNKKLQENNHGITIKAFANDKFRITTLEQHYDYLVQIKKNNKKRKLSQSNLEVLAIIAYKSPITKMEIEKIRGVNSDYIITKLKDLDLIEECGRKIESIGKPLLFRTTDKFMKEFNLNSIKDLPDISFDNDKKEEDLFS